MLTRLQRKTIIPAQIIGYALTLFVGVSILLTAFQAFSDIKLLLTEQTDVFDPHAVTVSKNVSIFNTMDKASIYFDEDELEELRGQSFVKDVAEFKSATYSPWAEFDGRAMGNLHTELFFESIQDKYIDVETEFWEWDSTSDFIPIIIPEDFLNLYNFCFAESQSLPVISQGTMKMVSFSITLAGNGQKRVFTSRIVGFSKKIKTILVPEKFMDWSNEQFGKSDSKKPTRLLVEFKNANDERIPTFFEKHGYAIDENELEYSKMSFFFKLALGFVIAIAGIIILLSMAFIVMGFNLIIQRNRKMLVNLYNIGYSPSQIAKFYQVVISTVTFLDVLAASFVALKVRGLYLEQLSTVFDKPDNPVHIWVIAAALLIVLLIVYNLIIWHNIKKTVEKQ
jgi:hypothetical protein